MSIHFVPLCSFDNYIPAHIALGRLESENIRCYLQDENTVTIDPFLAYAVGGIKLMVADVQAERALRLLSGDDQNIKKDSVVIP
jgi:hypothetical protein